MSHSEVAVEGSRLAQVEAKVLAACDEAKKAGFKLVRHMFLNRTSCCAMGAVVATKLPKIGGQAWPSASGVEEFLEINYEERRAFEAGFDGHFEPTTSPLSSWRVQSFFLLGQQIATKVL